MLEKWKVTNTKEKYTSKPFNVVEKTYNKPDTSKFTASVLNMPDWANIIAVNPEGKILLIEQFRFGTDEIELEIPGGCIEPNEMPMDGAIRELEEETGFISDSIKQIGVVDSNPAIQTNKCYTFLAKNVLPKGKINFDPDEMIESRFASYEECKKSITEGKITNVYIVAAFYWYDLYLRGK